ncbi:fungal trichothecene efflux pump [Plectosphaerella plurivora]|uniref:Fungal trichothecene efflux pump n=1 Tax=Plectosphaerella plurivora TaxID=936078 RepID=A0A9P8V5M0_9PEZI|nr:fungal trichothecene efflux pump [Plectosphaerella plurivora]
MSASFGPAVALGFTSIASIVVQVSRDLGDDADFAWVVGAWSLATACSFSLAGPLSDVFGRKSLILSGQAIALIGAIVGATAQSVASLIAAETVIGLGAGFIFVAYAGVPEMLPNKWRSVGVGILEGGIMVPWGSVGVLLANALYEFASWRWIYYLGIIVEAIALVGTAYFYRPTSRPRGDYDKTRWQQFKEVDWTGLSLFTLGLATCIVGLTWGGSPAHPWDSASTLVPILVGAAGVAAAFVYDFNFAKNPIFPIELFKMWRGYMSIGVGLIISGMNFHAMAALHPQGSLFMFTSDGVQIGLISLPMNIISFIVSVLIPIFAHKIGHIKWQFVAGMTLQVIFLGASAATTNPNNKWAWAFVPGIGVPMFLMVTILGYAIASLHVPYTHLGVATGLLGTFRSAGGAIGNAIFNTVFQDKFRTFSGEEIPRAAIAAGLNPADLGAIIPGSIVFNLGVPNALDGIEGMTPAIADALRVAVRNAYGRAFQFVFYITIPFGVLAVIASLWVEDPTPYMTNHIQSAMDTPSDEKLAGKAGSEEGVEHFESTPEAKTIG